MTNVHETVNDGYIELRFPYNETLIQMVKSLPDRTYTDDPNKHWYLPATPFHAKMVRKVFNGPVLLTDPKADHLANFHDWDEPDVDVPDGLLEYQKEGVRFIEKTNGRAFLGDDMGIGKGVQTIAWCHHRRDELERCLIIVPTTGLHHWQSELKEWLGATSQIVASSKEDLVPADFYIMSYAMLRIRQDELVEMDWDLVVFDECTRITNMKAKRTKAAKRIAKGVEHTLMLSGTPFLNKHLEMFYPLHIMDPKAFPNWFYYANRYTMGKASGWTGIMFRDELVNRLSYSMIRRTKEEVKDELPSIRHVVVPMDLEPQDRAEYMEAELEMIRAPNPFSKISETRHALGRAKRGAIVQWAKDFLEDSDEKLVIYVFHIDVMKYVVSKLEDYGATFINGSVSGKVRRERQQSFQNSRYPRVIVINQAASEIINLHKASNILFGEREWVPGTEEQAWSRLHRTGQHNPVTAWFLSATGTMDHDLEAALARKDWEFGEVLPSDEIETTIARGVMDAIRERLDT